MSKITQMNGYVIVEQKTMVNFVVIVEKNTMLLENVQNVEQ